MAGGELAQQQLVLAFVAVDVGLLQGLVQAAGEASASRFAAFLGLHGFCPEDQGDRPVEGALADDPGGVCVPVGDPQAGQQPFACLSGEDGGQAAGVGVRAAVA
ncbi:hypothetical protein O1M54_13695 [Streptomyces diastatochromogenes]|nr:hypothetical protein [Streptomyces diastatochromogenes]